jgi:hypothetical protein
LDNLAAPANRAAELFEHQPASEKRKLLRFLVEECRWSNGSLTYRWKPPFERVAEVEEQQKAAYPPLCACRLSRRSWSGGSRKPPLERVAEIEKRREAAA